MTAPNHFMRIINRTVAGSSRVHNTADSVVPKPGIPEVERRQAVTPSSRTFSNYPDNSRHTFGFSSFETRDSGGKRVQTGSDDSISSAGINNGGGRRGEELSP